MHIKTKIAVPQTDPGQSKQTNAESNHLHSRLLLATYNLQAEPTPIRTSVLDNLHVND